MILLNLYEFRWNSKKNFLWCLVSMCKAWPHKGKNFHSYKKISFVFDDFLTIENDKKNILYVKSHQKVLVHFHQISRKPFYLSLFRCQKAFYHCLTLINQVLPNHDSLFLKTSLTTQLNSSIYIWKASVGKYYIESKNYNKSLM